MGQNRQMMNNQNNNSWPNLQMNNNAWQNRQMNNQNNNLFQNQNHQMNNQPNNAGQLRFTRQHQNRNHPMPMNQNQNQKQNFRRNRVKKPTRRGGKRINIIYN